MRKVYIYHPCVAYSIVIFTLWIGDKYFDALVVIYFRCRIWINILPWYQYGNINMVSIFLLVSPFCSELAKARNAVLHLVNELAVGGEFRLSVMMVDRSGAEQDFNLNNREFLPQRVRKLINGFLPDHLDTAYIAIWPQGEEAMAWLEQAYRVHGEYGPIYVLILMQDRFTLLPEEVVDARALDHIKRFCDVPLSRPLTIEHLVKKGLLTSEGKLHDDIHILAVSGHHSTVQSG
jgi:hypothetical protein